MTPARRFALASAIGGAAAIVLLGWFATRRGLFGVVPLGNFYEVQARSWLHGRWDAGPDAYAFERFAVHGRYYTYFGPWPALLRLPIVAFTHRLDGRTSQVACLLAAAVLLAGVAGLSWEARRSRRGDAAVTTRECALAGGLVFLVGCGTTTVFLASWTAVYHEAILWGAAWAVVSSWLLVRHLRSASRHDLAGAAAAASFAVLSRGSVGMGPVVAIGLLGALRLLDVARRRTSWRRMPGPALAALVPFGLYAAVNEVKFGSPLGLPPYQLQDRLLGWPTRRPALAANGGTLFGLRYAPTIALHYLRPDGIRFDRLFPWVAFPPTATVVGRAVFEALNPAASLPATATLPVLLALVGLVVLVRHPGRRGFLLPLAGAVVGASGAFSLAFVDQRYQGDLLPVLVLAGVVGAWWIAGRLSTAGRAVRPVALAVLAALAVWSCWANDGLAFLYARAYAPYVTASDREALVRLQLAANDHLGLGAPSRVGHGSALPTAAARAGSLYVVGDCAGLLWSDGRVWHTIEQTPGTGLLPLRLRLDPGPAGPREPVLASTGAGGTSVLWVSRLTRDEVRFELEWVPQQGGGALVSSAATHLALGATVPVLLRLDPSGGFLTGARLDVAGRRVLTGITPVGIGAVTLGAQSITGSGATALAGEVEPGPRLPTPACDRLVADERRSR